MQVVAKILKSGSVTVIQRRLYRVSNVIAGPPQVRIPFPEKAAHGLTILCGVLATPAYILGNLKNYTSK